MSQDVALILFEFAVLIFGFSIHEAAHAWMASRLGDQTARMLGRVTLNPVKHIDPLGSVILPLIAAFYHWPLIGWAKPCPVTTRNFRHYRRDDILVTVAGPLSNLFTATACLIILLFVKHVVHNGWPTIKAAAYFALGAPGISLNGQSILFPLSLILFLGIVINLMLFAFNLIPIPPLDGSRVLLHFLPPRAAQIYSQIGMFSIILFFLIGGRLLNVIFTPIFSIFFSLLQAL